MLIGIRGKLTLLLDIQSNTATALTDIFTGLKNTLQCVRCLISTINGVLRRSGIGLHLFHHMINTQGELSGFLADNFGALNSI